MPSLFGLSAGRGVTPKMGFAAANQQQKQEPQRRGLFGRAGDWMGRDNGGVSNGDRLSTIAAMLRDDPMIGQRALESQQHQQSLAQQRFDEMQAQEGQRNTQQKDILQREQRAEVLGLQGRERELFIRNGGDWATATAGGLYDDVGANRYRITPDNPDGVYLPDPVANEGNAIRGRQVTANERNVNSQIADRNADNARLDQAAARETNAPRGGYTAAGMSDDYARVTAPLRARENDLAYARSYQARLAEPDAVPDNTSDGALLTLVAGAIQTGVLTDGDVNRTVGTTASLFANRLQSFMNGSGSLDAQTRQNLFQLADEMTASVNEQRTQIQSDYSTVARRNNIDPADVIGLTSARAPAGEGGDQGGDLTPEEERERQALRARFGG